MTKPRLDRFLRVRVNDEDLDELKKTATERNLDQATLARIFIRDGLVQFDRKHLAQMEQIKFLQLQNDALQKLIEKSNTLTAAALAAVSLLESERFDRYKEGGKDRLKENIKSSFSVGAALNDGFESGAFK